MSAGPENPVMQDFSYDPFDPAVMADPPPYYRVLRDENPDIMDEFLSNGGKSRAIPVFVFYTADLRYIAHFTERSAGAHAELATISDQIKSRLNLPQSATYATLPDPDRQTFIREVIAAIQPRSDAWRRESIGEMRKLLSGALKI